VRLIEDSGAVVVAAVGDGPSLVAAVVELRPDVSVVDVRMPPSQRDEGLQAAIEARRRVPGAPLLVLSQYVERQYASELLADGAGGVGYLLKDRVADVREFIEALRRENVGTSVHFIPLHLHPYYRERYGFQRGDFPVAEKAYERIVSLPLYPKMSEGDVEDVIKAVSKVVSQHRR
jgi:DNA-binding NarL/FixJ family response regulator